MYHSLPGTVLTFVITVAVLLFLAGGDSPWRMVKKFFVALFTEYQFFMTVALMLSVLLFNKAEIFFENHIFPAPWDMTPKIYSLEGNTTKFIQEALYSDVATNVFSFVYVFLFPALVLISLIIYKYRDNEEGIRRVFIAFTLNYLLAIPFYLFFPVKEVWAYNPQVSLAILKVYPTFNIDYRQLSDLDNCFPSLHTSVSWSMAFSALLAREKGMRVFTVIGAILITLSTLYLGIHWLSDVVGGIVLAAAVVAVGHRFCHIPQLIPQPRSLRWKRWLVKVRKFVAQLAAELFS